MLRFWSRLSLRVKVPLLVGGLVVAVVSTVSWAAYQNMGQAAVAVARQRLDTLAVQLATMFQTSAKQTIATARATAADEAFRAFLRTPNARTRARAVAALTAPAANQPQQVAERELWDREGRPVLNAIVHGPHVGAEPDPDLRRTAAGADSGAMGHFRVLRDSVVYSIAVPVVEPKGGRQLGYLVTWRKIATSAQGRDAFNKLIGSHARMYFGDPGANVWTDLASLSTKPPVDVREAHGPLSYERPGFGQVLASARSVPGTPWTVLLEFDRETVLAQARVFLRQLAWIGLGILVVGLLGALVLSRQITQPLRELTGAAEAMATGDYTRLVALSREDELGRLGDAFNTMEANVRESHLQLEEKVRERTTELRERNEELEAFAYSISHDLRAPLRAMHGFSQALLEDYGERLDETGRKYAERVVVGAKGMDQLIQDLLAYSRVSREDLRLGYVDLARVTRQAAVQLQDEIAARGARLLVDEPLPAVVGHEGTLAQVVANLLGNAVKFVPPGTAPELRVRAERRDGRVRLWFEDNGIGIAPEHHERIFRVFERLHGVEQYPGTGIGLAIVRKGMERMGGRAGVESKPGAGSRFWIELPAVENADAGGRRHDSAG
jgi:signal transduction histidine kinase